MALSSERKKQLSQLSLPGEDAMRHRIRNFLLRSGMTQSEFADEVGYSRATVGLFLTGRYDQNHPLPSNSLALRAAVKEYMDLHEVNDTYDAGTRHYSTAGFEQVRRAALNALRRGTAYVVDGPPGTEKTHSLRQIEREVREKKLGRFVYVYARVGHSPQSFLQEACCSAGIPNRGNIDQLIRKLRFFLGAGRTVFGVDEAQHLDDRGLEVLRQLLDLPPFFGVVLAGSHDLTQRLSHWQMEQWRSRLRKTINLDGPTRAEARAIMRGELGHLTDAECDATIEQCTVNATRISYERGKSVERPFQYTSVRDLFFAIERVQELMAEKPRKVVAA